MCNAHKSINVLKWPILSDIKFYKTLRRWFNKPMSVRGNIHFGEKEKEERPMVFPTTSGRVNLNNLMKKVKEEEKKIKRGNLAISLATLSAVAVFGIILTL